MLICLLIPTFSVAQQGANDPTFNPTDMGFGFGDGANNTVYASAVQADGKIIVGGWFTNFNGTSGNYIARLNGTSGDNDLTFNSGTGANNYIYSCAVQADGKIIIGGDFTSYNGTSRTRLARLNTDGTIDATFTPGAGANNGIYTISVQTDGKIIIGGWFTSYNGTAINRIARLNTDGTLDATFAVGAGANNNVYTSSIQSDGKIIIGGTFTSYNGTARTRIARINTDGTVDATFNPGSGANNFVFTSAVQSDGKIIVGGFFTSYNGVAKNNIVRINSDGTLDATFNIGTGASAALRTCAIQSDGKIVISGEFTSYNGTARSRIARINTDGTLDVTYTPGTGASANIYTSAIQSDDKVIIGGDFTSYNGSVRVRIARINTDGSVDATIGYGTAANMIIRCSLIQPNDKIIVGGEFTTYNSSARSRIVRINPDGSTDATFTPGSGANNTLRTMSIQSDGKIIIGGDFNGYNAAATTRVGRVNTNGSSDAAAFNTSTGANNIVYTSAIQTDGKIIIGGNFTSYGGTARNYIARINSNASNDATFTPGTGADGLIYSCALQSDGKIIIGGNFTNYNGSARSHIARLNSDGTLDAAFTPGTGTDGIVYSSYVQSDGKIIIAGSFTTYNGTARNNIARLNPDGSIDASFNPGTGANNTIYTTCVQTDGKIIIGGNFTTYNGTARNYLARLNSNGSLDLTFNIGTGANNTIYTTAIQSDGNIIIGGAFSSYNGVGRNRIARVIGECIIPSITGTTAAARCGTGSVTLGATSDSGTLNWYANSTGGVSLATGTSFTTPSISNNTTYYIEASNGGCSSLTRTAITATVNALPTISVNSGSICAGNSFTITPGGASTYTIQGGGAVKTPTANASYTVTGTSAAGCVASAFATSNVTVNALPVISANSGSICAGKSFTITPGGASTYTIQGGSAVKTPTANASYTVTGTSAAGCVASAFATSNVTVIALPVISVNSGSICAGNSFTITPGGASTYTIQGGGAVKTPTANASYTVTGTSAAGCVASAFATSNVTVNALPVISANSGSICAGKSFTITPGGASTYTIQGGSAVKTPTANASYTVTGTSAAGCVASAFATSNVTVIALPVISANSGSICAGNSFTITPGGASTYTIQGGGAVKTPTANASYTVTGTSAAGCVASAFATSNVTVNALPVISVNSGSICAGNSFTITPGGASTYTIQGGGAVKTPTANANYTVTGTSAAGCVASAFATSNVTVIALPVISVNSGSICAGNSFTITPGGASTYTIQGGGAVKTPTANASYTVTGTSAAGCVASAFATSNVTVSALPVISVNSGSICAGNSFTITPGGATTYTYSSGNIVTPLTNTNYTVTGTGANGCVNSSISSVTVSQTPTVTAPNGAICPGNSFTLSPSGANTYTYSSGTAIVSPTTTSTYSISGTSINGCVSNNPAVVTVTVANTLTISITGSNVICDGQAANLAAGGATTYTWSTGETLSAIAPTPSTNTTYSVVGASGSCSNTATINVTVNALPAINATTSNTLLCTGETATLTASGASTYTWNPGGNGTAISVTPTVTTDYTVTGTDANGCDNNAVITQDVSLCTGINQWDNNGYEITIFPNPSSGHITVSYAEEITSIVILNTLGAVVQTENTHSFSVTQLPNGIYFAEIHTEKGTVTKRFLKQ